MLTRSNVLRVNAIPRPGMTCPGADAGADFDPDLLPDLLEHGGMAPLELTEGQCRLIKKLTVQRQRLQASLHALRQGNQSHAVKLQAFERERKKAIALEYELYRRFSLKQKQIGRQLLKDRGIL